MVQSMRVHLTVLVTAMAAGSLDGVVIVDWMKLVISKVPQEYRSENALL